MQDGMSFAIQSLPRHLRICSLVVMPAPRDTLKKAENATVGRAKPLIFHDLKSAARNFSDGVSRFRQSWLEVEMAVLRTDVGSGVWAGRPRTSQEEELP